MKLSTIIRAIVRPYVEAESDEHEFTLNFLGLFGPGVGVAARANAFPKRATVIKVGGLEIAWWGRDTLVHPVEAP